MRAVSGALFVVLPALLISACTHDGGSGQSPTPVIFQDSIEADPNPAWLYEDATFSFAWQDKDGDMERPIVTLRVEDEDGDEHFEEVADVQVDGRTGGAIWFDLFVTDGFQGTYFVTVTDEAGHTSNEIELFLYVNPTPRINDPDGELPYTD